MYQGAEAAIVLHVYHLNQNVQGLAMSAVTVHTCILFSGLAHLIGNVHINTRCGKELFHTSSMTSLCSKV